MLVYSAKNISFSYRPSRTAYRLFNTRNTEPIISNQSLKIFKGDNINIFGDSGCGKSILLKLLSRIYLPDSGSISTNSDIFNLSALSVGWKNNASLLEIYKISLFYLNAPASNALEQFNNDFSNTLNAHSLINDLSYAKRALFKSVLLKYIKPSVFFYENLPQTNDKKLNPIITDNFSRCLNRMDAIITCSHKSQKKYTRNLELVKGVLREIPSEE